MPLTVRADHPIGEILAAQLSNIITGDTTLVQLERSPSRSSFPGFDDVLTLAPSGQPVVMMAFTHPVTLAADRRYHLAMSYPNVRFERLPLRAEEIALIFQAMQTGSTRNDNPLIRQVFALPHLQTNELSAILHDLGHAQEAEPGSQRRQDMDSRWIPRARKLFGNLEREALIALLENVDQPATDYAPFASQKFEVIACDVEGTLMRVDGSVNEELLADLKEFNQVTPVVLWTGGNLEEIDRSLRQAGIVFPLIPKQVMRGTTVFLAIDDESAELLAEKYGIKADQYRQV